MNRRRTRLFHRLDLLFPSDLRDEAATLLWELDCQGIEESDDREGNLRLAAYFAPEKSPPALRTRLLEKFPGCLCGIETVRYDPDEWLLSYRRTFEGFPIDSTFYVHPPWDQASSDHRVNIELEPGHGFGTGTHESTRLALSALGGCLPGPSTLLDVGTGSGILATGAGLLDPSLEITALDIDPLAVHAARETLERNGVRARLMVGEIRSLKGSFDLVVANLTGPLLVALAPDLGRLTGRMLVVSGLTEDESEWVKHHLTSAGSLCPAGRSTANGWCCFVFERIRGEAPPAGLHEEIRKDGRGESQ